MTIELVLKLCLNPNEVVSVFFVVVLFWYILGVDEAKLFSQVSVNS